jgi:lysophospholipase L1-like esterase
MRSKLFLILLGLVLGLVFAEGLLRLVDISRLQGVLKSFKGPSYVNTTHELFGWALVPNAEFTFESERHKEFKVQVKINSKGIRDREYDYQKTPGTFRILVLGDSFSAAFQVPLEETWHELLESRLGQTSPCRIEIVNAGMPGWGTGQELLYYRHEGYKYDPDLILLQIFANDVYDNYPDRIGPGQKLEKPLFFLNREQLELKNFPYRPAGIEPGGSRVYKLVKFLLRPRARWTPQSPSQPPPPLFMYSANDYLRLHEAPWRLTMRLMQELNAETAKHGAKLAAFYIPEKRQIDPAGRLELLQRYPETTDLKWNLDNPNMRIGAFLQQQGVPYFDLTSYFREELSKTGLALHFLRDKHLNPAGNRRTSELLHPWLQKQILCPRGKNPQQAATGNL